MSAREKVSCFDCNSQIILKNLKVHYQRFHPTKPVKHRSINETSVAKLFNTLKRKPGEEENVDENSAKKRDIGSPGKSLETTAPLEEHLINSSTARDTSLHEKNLSSVDENDNQNEDCVSVNKDILNKILSSIQGKTFFVVLF